MRDVLPPTTDQKSIASSTDHAAWITSQGWNLLSDGMRRRTFFKYEKRVRDLSPPDKVFEYFASEEREGGARWAPLKLPPLLQAS